MARDRDETAVIIAYLTIGIRSRGEAQLFILVDGVRPNGGYKIVQKKETKKCLKSKSIA
jgi:hypothetical protein